MGSTYAVVTMVVMAAWLRGGKAAVGGCMGVVVKSIPTLVLPVLELW